MNFKKNILSAILIGTLSSTSVFAEDNSSKIPLNEISKIAEIFSIIDENYVEEPNKKEMLIEAIKGMVSSLDPYSSYLEKSDFESMKEGISGEMVGIGVVLSGHEKGLEIQTVIEGGSASNSDLESGDIIIKVGDKYVIGDYEYPFAAIEDIKGTKSTNTKFSVYKKYSNEVVEYELERTKFTVKSVSVKKLDHEYGYISLQSFQSNTANQLRTELIKFIEENKETKGYVLDMRSNPGGLLNSAVEISDMFLNKGVIVSTKGRNGIEEKEESSFGDILNGKPIVVLINSGTASAAEIVSGALQDNKRAFIVGQTSYGKGSVQTIFPLNGNDSDGLKLTIARYYTPNGRSIQAEGIVPDIKIPRLKSIKLSERKASREKDNAGHITNDTEYTSEDKVQTIKNEIKTEIDKDYALYMATNAIKSLTFERE